MQKKEESAASHNTGVSDAKGKSCRRETIIHVCYTFQQRPDHFLNKTWHKKKKKKNALLAVAGVHKMKQIPQEKLRRKSKSILKAEKYLPDQVWNNAIDFTLTSMLIGKVNRQEEKNQAQTRVN